MGPSAKRATRRWLVVAAVALVLLFFSFRATAVAYTDYLWFEDVGVGQVFSGLMGSQLTLLAVVFAFAAAVAWVNLMVVTRVSGSVKARWFDGGGIRLPEVTDGSQRWIRLVASLIVGLVAAGGATGHWQEWMLFRNAVPFGVKDPQFGLDVSFYVFRLPFLRFLISRVMTVMALAAIVSLLGHYLTGAIRFRPGERVVEPGAKLHLSVMAALVVLVKGVEYWFSRYALVRSERGFAQGAFFTDVTAVLPGLTLLALICGVVACLFIVNIRRSGLALPLVGLALLVVVSVLVGTVYPAVVQSLRVPAESQLELPYIERNVAATRAAFGLAGIEEKQYPYRNPSTPGGGLTGADITAARSSVRNVRLWDPDPTVTKVTFARLQSQRDFYEIGDVDVDRYPIDGESTQVVIAVRELRAQGLPNDNWSNRHLAFTHGFGVVAAPANAATKEGLPNFSLDGLPPKGMPEVKEPRIYYGEANTGGQPDYALVNTRIPEVDYLTPDGQQVTSVYRSERGVAIGGVVRRAAFAMRWGERNVLLGNQLTDGSKVLYVRNIKERARKAAPFLKLDSDPYPVVANGQVKWVLDAYTTSDEYPYSQRPDTAGLAGSDLRNQPITYIRNSVKILIDAYDGSLSFYVMDPGDPIIQAWNRAFPGMLVFPNEKKPLPPALADHLRYPEDLFRIQAQLFGTYHIRSGADFFRGTDAWQVASDPGLAPVAGNAVAAPNRPGQPSPPGNQTVTTEDSRIPATYLLQTLPGDPDGKVSFSANLPFVPKGRQDTQQTLTAFLTARSDRDNYGRLTVYVLPRNERVDGPKLVDSNMQADGGVAAGLRAIAQPNSELKMGNMVLLPIKNSLLYVRPLYLQAADNPLPKLEQVIVAYGNRVVMRKTLQEALAELFGAAPATREEGGSKATTPATPSAPDIPESPATAPVSPDVQRQLSIAQSAFEAAERALREGRLDEYHRQVEIAKAAVAEAARLSGVNHPSPPAVPTTPGSPTTTSGAPVTPSAPAPSAPAVPADRVPGLAPSTTGPRAPATSVTPVSLVPTDKPADATRSA